MLYRKRDGRLALGMQGGLFAGTLGETGGATEGEPSKMKIKK